MSLTPAEQTGLKLFYNNIAFAAFLVGSDRGHRFRNAQRPDRSRRR
ncbi:MAG: hypothetical protein R3B90_12820 [Planctomycetaceae bacterium]